MSAQELEERLSTVLSNNKEILENIISSRVHEQKVYYDVSCFGPRCLTSSQNTLCVKGLANSGHEQRKDTCWKIVDFGAERPRTFVIIVVLFMLFPFVSNKTFAGVFGQPEFTYTTITGK